MRLLGPLGWHGVAMVEFKEDDRTGRPMLIEVNGRFWGSLQLAIDAGVDFPVLNGQLALGQPPDVPPIFKVGLKSRWLLGDLDHLLIRLLHSDRDLPDTAPSKLKTLNDFLKFFGPTLRYDVWRRDDPRPALHEIRQYLKPADHEHDTCRPTPAIGCRRLATVGRDRSARPVPRSCAKADRPWLACRLPCRRTATDEPDPA
jgi:predicted ATP-grasp superfamily ATP-dependent carboligase